MRTFCLIRFQGKHFSPLILLLFIHIFRWIPPVIREKPDRFLNKKLYLYWYSRIWFSSSSNGLRSFIIWLGLNVFHDLLTMDSRMQGVTVSVSLSNILWCEMCWHCICGLCVSSEQTGDITDDPCEAALHHTGAVRSPRCCLPAARLHSPLLLHRHIVRLLALGTQVLCQLWKLEKKDKDVSCQNVSVWRISTSVYH